MSNDRLKFRAWYSEEKKMEYQEGKTPAWLGDILTNSYYIPMQCTGVKDKNGNLIYEGDVIKTETGAQIVVDWDPTKAGFIPWTWAYDDYCDPSMIEIVKNVYENPELIDDK